MSKSRMARRFPAYANPPRGMAGAARTVIRAAFLFTIVSAAALGAVPSMAQEREVVKPVFEHALPNAEGMRMVAVLVTYPPGAKSLAHHHAGSAFIYAYVLSGVIRSQVGDEPAKIYHAGESFYEAPGSHHRISENGSDTESASMLAVFVVGGKDGPLTVPDGAAGGRAP